MGLNKIKVYLFLINHLGKFPLFLAICVIIINHCFDDLLTNITFCCEDADNKTPGSLGNTDTVANQQEQEISKRSASNAFVSVNQEIKPGVHLPSDTSHCRTISTMIKNNITDQVHSNPVNIVCDGNEATVKQMVKGTSEAIFDASVKGAEDATWFKLKEKK